MINILPKDVADKIAAGEVIERPVSVVKELVENSIDAGASDIRVEIRKGGRSEIRVTDNGRGLEADDMERAFLRHATSKIRTTEDLAGIETLGFRGEALASIAAVTRTEMISRTEEEKVGRRVVMHGGEPVLSEAVGCPAGTTVIVTDLFYNTPARAKFLKSEGAESGLVIDMMSRLALTVPAVRVRLINNGRTVFATSGNGDLLAAIIAVYKEREYRDLVKTDHRDAACRVYGYISRPSVSRSSRRSQYFFVNGRVVRSRLIERGLASGYRERLFEGRYPIAFLFIEAAPDRLDVNIHPGKREVHFDDEVAVLTCIRDAVTEALTHNKAVSEPHDTLRFEDGPAPAYLAAEGEAAAASSTAAKKEAVSEAGSAERGEQVSVNIKQFLSTQRRQEYIIKEAEMEEVGALSAEFGVPDIAAPENRPFDFDDLKFGEVIFDTYLTATDGTCFYLFDQHAVHERVNYERYLGAYMSSEKHGQLILTPFSFDVPGAMAADDPAWTEELRRMAFDVESFGENTYIVRQIPEFTDIGEAERFLRSFVDSWSEGIAMDNRIVIDKLIMKSCKEAIKAHDVIGPEETESLIEQLKACRNPFSCPHGRPTFIRISLHEIERMFRRTV